MQYSFEQQKNLQATVITAVITAVLFLIFFYVHYNKPIPPAPSLGEGIEVNLGDAETGLGDVQPMAPGASAEQTDQVVTPKAAETTLPITPPATASEEDVAVNHPTKNKPNKNNLPPIEKPIPAPKPKAIFKGSVANGTGGNNTDSYNGAKNQGIAGGKGDQGNPNGNPNSDSYTGNAASGNGGSGGVAIRSGLDGRRITKLPSFEDDFNENAKVAVDITVNQAGQVIAASINPKGTTTSNSNIRNIALKKARSLKLNSGAEEEQSGTLIFNFKLRS